MNKANAARSSRTKYNCIARTIPRNHHIHLRLLSLFFILSSLAGPAIATLANLAHCGASSSMPVTGHTVYPAPVPLDSRSTAAAMVQRSHFQYETSGLVRFLDCLLRCKYQKIQDLCGARQKWSAVPISLNA